MSRDLAVDLIKQLRSGTIGHTSCRKVELPKESGIDFDGNITRVFVLNFLRDSRLLPMAMKQGRPLRIRRIADKFQHRSVSKDLAGSRLNFLFPGLLSVPCSSGRVL